MFSASCVEAAAGEGGGWGGGGGGWTGVRVHPPEEGTRRHRLAGVRGQDSCPSGWVPSWDTRVDVYMNVASAWLLLFSLSKRGLLRIQLPLFWSSLSMLSQRPPELQPQPPLGVGSFSEERLC